MYNICWKGNDKLISVKKQKANKREKDMLVKTSEKVIEKTGDIAGKLNGNRNGAAFAITVVAVGAIVAGVVAVAGKALETLGGEA